jgi:hypothetical protein
MFKLINKMHLVQTLMTNLSTANTATNGAKNLKMLLT